MTRTDEEEKALVNRAAYFGDVCAVCGRALDAGEPVYRWQWLTTGHAPVCATCHSEADLETWHSAPCDGCGRPVFNNHARARRWTFCSRRCQIQIETRQRKDRRRSGRALSVCINCLTAFAPIRSDARTCSPACRQALCRRRYRDR